MDSERRGRRVDPGAVIPRMRLLANKKPMAVEQPWALDLLSFGLAYPDRRSNQDGQYNSKRWAGSLGRTRRPPPAEWEGIPHSVAGVTGIGCECFSSDCAGQSYS
jgi:hypothetical protein